MLVFRSFNGGGGFYNAPVAVNQAAFYRPPTPDPSQQGQSLLGPPPLMPNGPPIHPTVVNMRCSSKKFKVSKMASLCYETFFPAPFANKPIRSPGPIHVPPQPTRSPEIPMSSSPDCVAVSTSVPANDAGLQKPSSDILKIEIGGNKSVKRSANNSGIE